VQVLWLMESSASLLMLFFCFGTFQLLHQEIIIGVHLDLDKLIWLPRWEVLFQFKHFSSLYLREILTLKNIHFSL